MMQKWIQLLAGGLLVGLLSGCASMEKEGSAESWDDQQISQVVRERLSEDVLTGRYGFQVQTTDGVVSLYGYVPEINTRARALAVAESSPGVIRVVDYLRD